MPLIDVLQALGLALGCLGLTTLITAVITPALISLMDTCEIKRVTTKEELCKGIATDVRYAAFWLSDDRKAYKAAKAVSNCLREGHISGALLRKEFEKLKGHR